MKILIVTDHLPPYLNANSSIIYRVAKELQQTYGQEIVILGLQTAPEENPYPDFQTISIDGVFRYTSLVPAQLKKSSKAVRVLFHPSIWPLAFRFFFRLRHPLYSLYRRRLRRILKELPDLDCVIAVNEPAVIPIALARLRPRLPWISYRLDTWREIVPGDAHRRKTERSLIEQACSAVVIPPTLRREYLSGETSLPPNKLFTVEFPNLRPLPENGATIAGWRDDRIHCAYVGQLHVDIRNPAFVVDLFAAARDAGLVLHIIGNSEVDTTLWQDRLPENVVLHGRVPYETAAAYIQAADVLVNLGNTLPDTLPSKIIDYFSSGKPILNFYRIKQCPTLPYMEKHPAALSVYEGGGLSPELVQQVIDFCVEHKGQRTPYAEMERLYQECTPAYVGRQIYEVICSVCRSEEAK